MALNMDNFIQRFLDEARDHLVQLGEGIATLEQGQPSPEQVNQLFRSAHTIKGSARMLRLEPLTQTAHALEDLLGALREQSLELDTHRHCPLLYQALDSLSTLLDQLETHRDPRALPAADDQLCTALSSAAQGTLADATPASHPPAPAEVPDAHEGTAEPEARLSTSANVRIPLERLDAMINLMGELVSSHARMRQLVQDSRQIGAQLDDATIRDQLHEFEPFSRNLREAVQSQETLMTELHDRALQLRMLPLATLFDSAGHSVRSIARSLGKEVDCRVRGAQIELDRQMIDQLADPLIHLLRNALDHGIESPDERAQAGKPRRGRIELRAWQDGGWVLIEIADDGRGMDPRRIRNRALHRGLMSAEQLDALSERELRELVFEPGFSTSELITDFSGRGVGMDVVRTAIVDQLQGQIQLHSQTGQGTRCELRLPLSLALMRVLIIETAGHQLGVTAQYVSELVRLPAGEIQRFAERDVVRVRNEFVPVLDLAELIELPRQAAARGATGDRLLLIAQARGEKLALIVDDLLDERDMVIKQLPEHLRQRPLIAGMVTRGHNQLVSLLQIPQILTLARSSRQPGTQAQARTGRHRILVVDDSRNTREIERDILEAWGYTVSLAENGQQGLERALQEDFDAVLTDVEMPFMDGFALTARLRQEPAYRERPILIITSREKETDRRRGIEVGADAYIVKGSFEQNNLLDTLRVLLG